MCSGVPVTFIVSFRKCNFDCPCIRPHILDGIAWILSDAIQGCRVRPCEHRWRDSPPLCSFLRPGCRRGSASQSVNSTTFATIRSTCMPLYACHIVSILLSSYSTIFCPPSNVMVNKIMACSSENIGSSQLSPNKMYLQSIDCFSESLNHTPKIVCVSSVLQHTPIWKTWSLPSLKISKFQNSRSCFCPQKSCQCCWMVSLIYET